MKISYLIPTWQEYHTYTRKLAEKILAKENPIDLIVAIARGGLTLGHLLTDYLGIPISVISIQSYKDIQIQGDVELKEGLKFSVKNKRVLLVDDVSDSGKTFTRAVGHIKQYFPSEIVTTAIYLKPNSLFKPNYYIEETDKWIVFPYENTETIKLMIGNMTKEGKPSEEIDKIILGLGYTSADIEFVRKHYNSKRNQG